MTAGQTDKPTLLVLDDDPLSRDILAEQLSSDYEVLTAANVTEAENQLFEHGHHVSLVLMDLHLDETVTGFEAIDYLRGRGMDLPVIMVTAKGDEETAVAALKKGFSDYLPKIKENLNRELLRSKVENAIEFHRLQRENDLLMDLIEESQQRLFSVYDSLDDVIMQIDSDCNVCSVNRAGAAYADSEPREVVGKPCWQVFDFYPCDERSKKADCPIYKTFLDSETNEGERRGEDSGRTYQYMTFITTHRGGEYVVYRETDVTTKRGIEAKLDEALRSVLATPDLRAGRRKPPPTQSEDDS